MWDRWDIKSKNPEFSELEAVVGEECLEIDLLDLAFITAIGTKSGAYWYEWVTYYTFSYSLNGYNWTYYLNGVALPGNDDQHTEVQNVLSAPFIARYIRIYPLTAFEWVDMRVEAYGTFDINATLSQGNSDALQTCMCIYYLLTLCSE